MLISCRKDPVLIKSGIETRIFGKLTDYHDKPISKLKIKVGEFKGVGTGFLSPESYEFVMFVDSTYTDSNGKYDFIFKTSGKGNFYNLYFGERTKPNEPQVVWDPFIVDITQSSNDMKYIGKEFEFNTINLVELYPCKVTFNLNDIETFPITPSHNLTYSFNLQSINSKGTSSQIIYIQKYNKQALNLLRLKNGIRQIAVYEFPASNIEGMTYQTISAKESDFEDMKQE